MNCEILAVGSSTTNATDEQGIADAKRKQFCDQMDLMYNEDQNVFGKKRKTEGDCNGEEVQETACPGMCCKFSSRSLSVRYSLHFVLTDSAGQSLHCVSDSFRRINEFPVFMWTRPFLSSQTLPARSNLHI
jgi:hypothetical protein